MKSGAKEPASKEEEKEEDNMDSIDADELEIKDETEPDGEFEDVDQVGEIEKEVSILLNPDPEKKQSSN